MPSIAKQNFDLGPLPQSPSIPEGLPRRLALNKPNNSPDLLGLVWLINTFFSYNKLLASTPSTPVNNTLMINRKIHSLFSLNFSVASILSSKFFTSCCITFKFFLVPLTLSYYTLLLLNNSLITLYNMIKELSYERENQNLLLRF